MLLYVLLAGFSISWLFALFSFILVKRYIKKYVTQFLSVDNEGHNQLYHIFDSFAYLIAARITASLMASLKGTQSGFNRSLEGALEEEGAQALPPAAGLVELLMPGAFKKISKNALAQKGLESIVSKVFKASGDSGSGNNSSQSSFDFNV